MTTAYDFSPTSIDGMPRALGEWRGKVLLIVNVASQCGFTPQYAGLEQVYRRLGPQGLVVLGFPCNQFGRQEPGGPAQIKSFCSTQYQVTFPMFAKVEVNGANTHPLYRWLKHEAKGVFGTKFIKWNFTKFLVDRAGLVVRRYGPTTKPERIGRDIEQLA
jgi:glutathione peroxidase